MTPRRLLPGAVVLALAAAAAGWWLGSRPQPTTHGAAAFPVVVPLIVKGTTNFVSPDRTTIVLEPGTVVTRQLIVVGVPWRDCLGTKCGPWFRDDSVPRCLYAGARPQPLRIGLIKTSRDAAPDELLVAWIECGTSGWGDG